MFSLILITVLIVFLFLCVPTYACCIPEAEIKNQVSKLTKNIFLVSLICFTLLALVYTGIAMYCKNYPESKSFYEFAIYNPFSFSMPVLFMTLVSAGFASKYSLHAERNRQKEILLGEGYSEATLKSFEDVVEIWESWFETKNQEEEKDLSKQIKPKINLNLILAFIILSGIMVCSSLLEL